MDEAINIPITIGGADKAAAELGKPAKALDTLGASAKSAGDAQSTLANTSQKLSAGLGALGGSLGQIDPLLGQFGASIGRAGGAIGSMTALIGGGPGVLFGGAVAVIGLLASAFASQASAADEARKRNNDYTESLRKLGEAADETARKENNMRLARQGTSRETVTDLQTSVSELRGQGRDDEADALIGDARRRAQNRKAEMVIEREIAAAEARGEGIGAENGAPRSSGGPRRREWTSAQQGMFESAMNEGTGGRGPALDMRSSSDLMSGAGGGDNDLNSFLGNPSQSASKGAWDNGGATSLDAMRKASKKSRDFMVTDAQAVKDAWLGASASLTDGFSSAFSALITGGKEASLAVLANTGDQMVAEGSKMLFTGAGQLLLGIPTGAGLVALGGAEIAAGTALGATIKAAQGGSGGGGGAARPQPGQASNDNGGSRTPGTTVVNVYSLNPTKETGHTIDRSMREAARKKNR